MAKKRRFSTFSLSFLDIMSCGFGAVILIFLIIEHDVNTEIKVKDQALNSEVNLLEEEIKEGELNLVKIRNTLSHLDEELAITEGLARRINDDIEAIANKIAILDEESDDQQILKIKEKLKTLLAEKQRLENERAKGNDARKVVGTSERQYLTGLKLNGAHTLILVDVSASMLDDTLVNIIRKRNMSDESKKLSAKWVRAVRTVEWLIAKLPADGMFQLYVFNTEVGALIESSKSQWLEVSDSEKLDLIVRELKDIVPQGGTSLIKAFAEVQQFRPMPDNILLLTDGLPTQGLSAGNKTKVSGEEREALFFEAVNVLPQGIPINVLLWPMEGDPMAASAFWKLAHYTAGSFMSPSVDWP